MSAELRLPYGHLQKLIRTGYTDKPDECWLWPGVRNSSGYGQVAMNGRMQYAHRVAYELHVGAIPDGLVLDHICFERDCFNPRHLEPVTHGQNMQNRARPGANNTSGHRGVYWNKRKSRWQVRVWRDGISHSGGYFRSLEDAVAAAERLRKELGFRDTTRRHNEQLKGESDD